MPILGPSDALSPGEWNAQVDYDSWTDLYTPDEGFALHHGGGTNYVAGRAPYSIDREMVQLRSWESDHLAGRWRGLAYGWGVGQTGTIYRIRGWGTYGAHTGDIDGDGISNNQEIIPIIWIASGDHHQVSSAAATAIEYLRQWILQSAPAAIRLYGHKEIQPSPTQCPGPGGMAYVEANRELAVDSTSMAFSKGLTENQWRDLYQAHIANPGGPRTPEGEQALINYWVRDAADRSEAEHLTTSASMFVELATQYPMSEFQVKQLIEADRTHLLSGSPIVARNA